MRKVVSSLILGILLVWSLQAVSASIAKQYKWEALGRTWTLTQAYAFDAYQHFRTLPRVSNYTAYADYIREPSDDEALDGLVVELMALADAAAFDAWDRLNLVVSFIQSLRYAPEEGEYPRYPLETLVEGCGDCEDMAILAAAIFQQMGYDVVLLAYMEEAHMAVGVRVTPPDPSGFHAYEWNGGTYYYVEPTGTGWAIGRIPPTYTSMPDIIAVTSAS